MRMKKKAELYCGMSIERAKQLLAECQEQLDQARIRNLHLWAQAFANRLWWLKDFIARRQAFNKAV